MASCKEMRETVEDYSLYVHGFLNPWIHDQRVAGKLKRGKHFSIANPYKKVKKQLKA